MNFKKIFWLFLCFVSHTLALSWYFTFEMLKGNAKKFMRRSLQHQKHVLKRPPIYNKTIYSFYSFTQKMYVWFTFQECHCTFEGQKSFYAIEDDPVCGPCAGIIEWYLFKYIWKPLEPAVTVIIILSFISEITRNNKYINLCIEIIVENQMLWFLDQQ